MRLTANDAGRVCELSRDRFLVVSFSDDVLDSKVSEPSMTRSPLTVAKLVQILLNTD